MLCFNHAYAIDNLTNVLPLENRPADEILDLLIPLLDVNDRIIANGANLIVKTSPEKLATIQMLLKQLDIPKCNLLITVMQQSYKSAEELNVETNPESEIQMHGMNADTRDINNNQNIQTIRILDGESAIIQTNKDKLIQNVSVFNSISKYGYPQNTISPNLDNMNSGHYSNSTLGANTQTQSIETSIGFAVTPRLLGQAVILDIQPWSENFQQGYNRQSQSAQTRITLKPGEWIEIGGVDNAVNVKNGMQGFNQSTQDNSHRILVKIDKLN